MILGKPNGYVSKPHLWFAWRPVVLVNGQIAWLERVNREWGQVLRYDMTGRAKHGSGWSYSKGNFVNFE